MQKTVLVYGFYAIYIYSFFRVDRDKSDLYDMASNNRNAEIVYVALLSSSLSPLLRKI